MRFSVKTDKEEYRVGEGARIIASLSGDNINVQNAKVWATVERPDTNLATTVRLKSTFCAASACECPVSAEGTGAPCYCPADKVVCQFEGSIDIASEGAHYITAYATSSGFSAKDETKFWAYSSSDTKYVRLDQKFELDTGDSAIVVDYSDMRLTLKDIIRYKCAENDPTLTNEKCIGESYAVVGVRAPLVYPTTMGSVETSQVDSDYTETVVRIKVGDSASVFGADVYVLDLGFDSGTFMVSKESGNNVRVKLSPVRQSVRFGQTAEYEITIKDLHPNTMSRLFDYRIRVRGLPFALRYPRSVSMIPGSEETVKLSVDTSAMIAVLEEESNVKAVSAATGSAVAIAPQRVNVREVRSVELANVKEARIRARTYAAEEVMPVASAERAETVKVAPNVVASGRTYSFKVLVYGEDGSEATATGVLNVLYEEPPEPPSEKLRLSLSEGWNLITLPGEGRISEGTCKGLNELYAFVYVKEIGDYMTLKEAADYMGEKRLREYLRLNSFWVYSFRECVMTFALEEATSLNELELVGGWNFLPVTQDMEGNSLSAISGDCDLEKSYYWNAGAQSWEKLSGGEDFTEDMLYKGFIVKAEDSCSFGWGAIIAPPPLPSPPE
jgi:hypothetical protein